MFVLFVCALISADVFAWSECESYRTAGFIFGCNTEDQGGHDYDYGTVVQTVGTGWCLKSNGSKGTEYTNIRIRCTDTSGVDDTWIISDRQYCASSPIKANQVDNAKYCVNKGNGTPVCVRKWSDYDGGNGYKDGCLYVTCDEGYKPNSAKDKCVADTTEEEASRAEGEKNSCTYTGGEWDEASNKCVCDSGKGLQPKDATYKECVCEATGHTWSYGKGACVKDGLTAGEQAQAAEKQRVARNNAQAAKNNKRQCEQTGGVYGNSGCTCDALKNMRKDGRSCTCIADHVWINASSPAQGCKKADSAIVRDACSAATNGTWNASTQKCVCNDADYELDVNAQTCKPVPALAECQPLMAQNKARWDATNKTCKCTQEGYALEDGECIETAEGAVARKANEMQTAKSKIANVHSKLKKTQDGFKVSAWKNEDGNFNTARLASDATAGVVLGTAGALITSKIVKKNQIEDGFEDIRCTIGGQSVAGWGDEFSVGTQM